MWANLLNILSRSGLGSCLPPRDMRDEANNSVMGLLFLSGDRWDGSGGARAEEGAAGWKGRPGCCYGTHPSFRCSGAKQAEQAVTPPCVLEGRSVTTTRQHAVCPSRLGHTLWPPSPVAKHLFLTASCCRHLLLPCPFICSIREIPSYVSGVPCAKHV